MTTIKRKYARSSIHNKLHEKGLKKLAYLAYRIVSDLKKTTYK
jgi:hypothetical protein